MKNIHVLPTEKSSRIIFDFDENYYLPIQEENVRMENQHLVQNRDIYITSDEDFKEGWYFNTSINKYTYVYYKDVNSLKNIYGTKPKHLQKIILTTDQDLIKDGVQAIDDEFLEWFVKNPSCKLVEVVEDIKYFNIDELRERHLKGLPHLYSENIGYKIIIPKEEIKQDWFCPKCNSYVSSECVTFEETHQICNTEVVIKEPKQETLEEAAKKYARTMWGVYYDDIHPDISIVKTQGEISVGDFIAGVKWQQEPEQFFNDDRVKTLEKGIEYLLKKQEKMYSEEEVYNIIEQAMKDCYSLELEARYSGDYKNLKQYFEQFKKK